MMLRIKILLSCCGLLLFAALTAIVAFSGTKVAAGINHEIVTSTQNDSDHRPHPNYVPATIPVIGAPGAYDPSQEPGGDPLAPSSGIQPTSKPAAPQAPPPRPKTDRPSPTTNTDNTEPDASEQNTVESATPTVAAELLALVNRDRISAGCAVVTLNASLVQQSQAWSEKQAADGNMSHSPGPTGFDSWGENVAFGYETATAVHEAWMNSPAHRDNILNCSFTVMGAGAADSNSVRYWTEQFAQ